MSAAKKLPTGVRRRVLADGTVRFDARWRDAAGHEVMTTHITAEEAENARYEGLRSRRRGGTGNPSGGRTKLVDWLEVWWRDRSTKKKASTWPAT